MRFLFGCLVAVTLVIAVGCDCDNGGGCIDGKCRRPPVREASVTYECPTGVIGLTTVAN